MLKTVIIATLAAITGPVSGAVVTTSRQVVNTTAGGNVTLPCAYNMPTSLNNLIVQWSFYSAKVKNVNSPSPCHPMNDKAISHCQKMVYMTDARGRCSWENKIYVSTEGRPYTSAPYKGRIEVANDTGNASIAISGMQPWETGVYTCEVFEATVKDNPVPPFEKSISVNVLAPPSRPLCSFSGNNEKVELGHVITLSCLSEIGLPSPNYHWTMLSGDTVKPVKEAYNPQTGLLVIGNLSKFEEGYYQCTASNFLGNSTCHIDLTIKHSEAGVVIGALIGAIVAAALIAVVVWFLATKEKKKRQQEKTKEMQVMNQKQPLTAEYVAVPNQERVPIPEAAPSKESTETHEYVTPEEMDVARNEAPESGVQQTA